MSVIFSDSNCELWYTMVPELDYQLIKMPYTINDEETFYDLGKSVDLKEFYNKVRKGSMPVTSAINPQQYIEIFEPFFKAGEDILYISFSSELSATFNHLETALKELTPKYPNAKFRRFDTRSISWGGGLQLYYAIKQFKEGKSLDDVVKFLEDFSERISMFFMVDSLQHLKKGGRLSTMQAAFGTLLSIKPILTINDGKLIVNTKANGVNKAISYMTEQVVSQVTDTDKYPIVVVDADSPDAADKLIAKLKEQLGDVDIWHYPVGPVVGTHCGPGTIGVIFHK